MRDFQADEARVGAAEDLGAVGAVGGGVGDDLLGEKGDLKSQGSKREDEDENEDETEGSSMGHFQADETR